MRKWDELEQSIMVLMYKNIIMKPAHCTNRKYLFRAGEVAQWIGARAVFHPQKPWRKAGSNSWKLPSRFHTPVNNNF